MKIKPGRLILLAGMLLAACAGAGISEQSATPAPWEPVPGDAEMQRVEVEQFDIEIISLESDPSQFALLVEGALPTPCHLLRVEVTTDDDQAKIEVEIYSIVDPDQICIQVLEPFSQEIPLVGIPNREAQVTVNDQLVGELSP